MSAVRLLAVGFIFVCTAAAWFTLGATVVSRTGEADVALSQEVAKLWGGRHRQIAPQIVVERPRKVVQEIQEKDAAGRVTTRRVTQDVVDSVPVPLDQSRVRVAIDLEPRRKGLLWYDTYGVTFQAAYRLHNPDDVERKLVVSFAFPSA